MERWCAWELRYGLAPQCTYYARGNVSRETVEKPNLDGVPALQRRRLGSLARTVFHVLSKCAESDNDEPVIFSSFLGEIQRTQDILNNIAANDEVSPASFSLSVHNAIGGQWSVIHNVNAPILALAPPANSPVPALLEAAGLLEEGIYGAVNVVFYEEAYPAFYAPFFASPPAPIALALRVISSGDQVVEGALLFSLQQLPAEPARMRACDNYALLQRTLSGDQTAVTIEEPQCNWKLERSR